MGCRGHENLESPRHLGAILLAVRAGQGFAECRGAGGGAAQQRERAEGLGSGSLCCLGKGEEHGCVNRLSGWEGGE